LFSRVYGFSTRFWLGGIDDIGSSEDEHGIGGRKDKKNIII